MYLVCVLRSMYAKMAVLITISSSPEPPRKLEDTDKVWAETLDVMLEHGLDMTTICFITHGLPLLRDRLRHYRFLFSNYNAKHTCEQNLLLRSRFVRLRRLTNSELNQGRFSHRAWNVVRALVFPKSTTYLVLYQ